MAHPYPFSSNRKPLTYLTDTWRNFDSGLSSPPSSPVATWSSNPDSYLHLLQRAYISLNHHSKDAGLLHDIQQYLRDHREISEDRTGEDDFFDNVSSLARNQESKIDHHEQPSLHLKSQPATPVSSRRASSTSYANFCTQVYDQWSETASNEGTECSADNLWNQFKQQIKDLQTENNNILSLVVDSELKLKNAAADINYLQEEEKPASTIVHDEEFFEDEVDERVAIKSRYSRQDTRLSYYDEMLPPSPTEVALRSLLKNCKEQEGKRNVLDETLSLLNRGYDDKTFRRDIRRILGTSSAGTNPMDDSESIIDIMIQWLRFLIILFLSVIICILNGPSSLGDQR
ncbi:hypothetical protein K450DRAFT_224170 [Umbelopsis ramanniana AG]|uniref:Uncharacterized protein n=1 Tax=Umbelopsis ramanniana AG TaxID=1314678 RepID=A0AAD5EGH5_UMBRA|nr:uncharacterized protein K450DRAFT_224170 [Umbelopsis ramanniana AG]KAI8583089.1 hypothetical protein K450DRAFT_224170 [Umbelopsis ramanniana AG]